MSNKTQAFLSVLGNPQNTHNFQVTVPQLSGIEILVSSTSFPTEKLRTITMYFQGEPVRFPTIPENEGIWNCGIPESESAKVFGRFMQHRGLIYNQRTGSFLPPVRQVIRVAARDLADNECFAVKMHGAFFIQRNAVDLENNTHLSTEKVWLKIS